MLDRHSALRVTAFLALVTTALVLAGGAAAQTKWNLTGTWKGVGGAPGTYEIRQSGTAISWKARSDDGHTWAHDFTGSITGDDIVGAFQDRKGYDVYQRGEIRVRIVDACHLRFVSATVGWGTLSWTKVGCTVTSTPTATTSAPPTIRATPEARAFLGLTDEPRSTARWMADSAIACNAVVLRALRFPGVTSVGEVPGQTSTGKHSNALLFSQGDFHELMDAIVPPSRLKADNVFVNGTRQYVADLRRRILAVKQKGSLQPADVLELALRVTNGSYPLAVLTAHNLLKDVAYTGRELVARGSHRKTFEQEGSSLRSRLQPQAQIAIRLANLRRDPVASADKMGPWYHAFAILSIGAIWNPTGGFLAATREHVFKKLGFFGKSEAGFNLEKAGTDYCFALAAFGENGALQLAELRDQGVGASLLANLKRQWKAIKNLGATLASLASGR